MAVKHIVEDVHEECKVVNNILKVLEITEPELNTIDETIPFCEDLIIQLLNVRVPHQAVAIKEYKISIGKVSDIFERIVKKHGDFEKVFVHCLQTLYNRIVQMNQSEVSAAAAIIFNVYDENIIPKAIDSFLPNLKSPDADQDIKKVICILCLWLRSSSGFLHLSKCIIDLMEGLRKMQKFELLLDIANSVIEQLFLTLIIPFMRQYVMPVICYILMSVQNDPTVFHKILPRIPKVLKQIELSISATSNMDSDIRENHQRLVDLIYTLRQHYSVTDGRYKELDELLQKYTISFIGQDILNVKPWHCVSPIKPREQGLPLGLNNMGNTCYMNSVLQALFLTRHFLKEIIQLEINSSYIQIVRELMALLLGSKRSQLSPNIALRTRPANFRTGLQQDSFEYLGHLLDQLCEEEKSYNANIQTKESYCNGEWNVNVKENVVNLESDNQNVLLNYENEMKKSMLGMDFDPQNFDNNNLDLESSLNATFGSNQVEVDMIVDSSFDYGTELTKEDNTGDCNMYSVPPSPSLTTPSPTSANISNISNVSNTSNATHGTNASNTSIGLSTTESAAIKNTLVHKVFSGNVVTTHKCLTCLTGSKTKDYFLDLQLSFPERQDYNVDYTVQQLIDAYFEKERLEGENQYSCDNCKKLCDGERSVKLTDGPANLILVIKHFRYERHTHVRKKVMQKISYDKTVEIKVTDASGETWNYTYRLYAVIVHFGINVDSGHYFTLALDANDNWFNFNDAVISRTTINEISQLNKLYSPYVFFYEFVSKQRPKDVCLEPVAEIHNAQETPYSTPPDYPSEDDQPESTYYQNKYSLKDKLSVCFKYSDEISIDSLPPALRQVVEYDNELYKAELRLPNMNQSPYVKRNYIGSKKPDDDRDPPSTCGQGPALITNRYNY